MAEWSQEQTPLPRLLRDPMADSCFDRIWLPRATVMHEFDTRHEALLSDLPDVRQSKERLEQPGEPVDFWLELGQGAFSPKDFEIGERHGASERIAGIAMPMEERFEFLILP